MFVSGGTLAGRLGLVGQQVVQASAAAVGLGAQLAEVDGALVAHVVGLNQGEAGLALAHVVRLHVLEGVHALGADVGSGGALQAVFD